MPSLPQLPETLAVSPSDKLMLDQSGTSHSVSVGILQAGLQPKLTAAQNTLLGRVSTNPGAPEPVGIGAGLKMQNGALTTDITVVAPVAYPVFSGIPTAPTPTPAPGDNSNAVATTAFVQTRLFQPVTLAGDISGAAISPGTGSITTTLPAITTPGTFAKVTVNAKGQVTGGSATLTPADIVGLVSSPVQSVAGQIGNVTDLSSGQVVATGSSTSRTLANRGADLPSVRDFGATGNGTTSDSLAINAAQASGHAYMLPSGSYYLDGAMNRSATPVFGLGPISLTNYGLSGTTNQGYWNGASGFYFAQMHTASVAQATVVINSINNQPPNSGESGALYVSTVAEAPGANSTGIAIIAQGSAMPNNTTASICKINAYASWDATTQGSGSVSEMDVHNSTGVDDPWPISSSKAKTGLFIVSDGLNKPRYAMGITASGSPFLVGSLYYAGGTSLYDLYGSGSGVAPRWYIDSSGNVLAQNLTGQNIIGYGSTWGIGNFSGSPGASIMWARMCQPYQPSRGRCFWMGAKAPQRQAPFMSTRRRAAGLPGQRSPFRTSR